MTPRVCRCARQLWLPALSGGRGLCALRVWLTEQGAAKHVSLMVFHKLPRSPE